MFGKLLLAASWGAFTISVLLVIASFLVSQATLLDQVRLAEKFLVLFDDSCERESKWKWYADGETYCPAAGFCIGVLYSVIFALFTYPTASAILNAD